MHSAACTNEWMAPVYIFTRLHYVRRHKVYLTQNWTCQVVWGFSSGIILLEPVSSLSGVIFNLSTKLFRVTSWVAADFFLAPAPPCDCLYLLPTSFKIILISNLPTLIKYSSIKRFHAKCAFFQMPSPRSRPHYAGEIWKLSFILP